MNSSWNKQIIILSLISAFIAVVGIISTQKAIFGSLFMPIIFLFLLTYMEKDLKLNLDYSIPSFLKVGDQVILSVTIKVTKGFGLLNMELPFYQEMSIVEGTNVHVLFKGIREREVTMTYTISSLRRGIFKWSDIQIEYLPVIGLKRRKVIKFPVDHILEVDPEIKTLKKSQFQLKSNRVKPRNSITRMGPPTHEFESIREYVPGDPFRSINWKSSAKTSYKDNLMVNVYEREGLKNFIFYVDISPYMSRGSTVENPLEYAIVLVLSGSRYLFSKSYNVGLWPIKLFNLNRKEFVVPSSGMDTFNQIKRSLLLMESKWVTEPFRGFDPSLTRMMLETRPSVMIMTSLERGNMSRIEAISSSMARFRIVPTIVDIRAESISAKHTDPRLGKVFSSRNYNLSKYSIDHTSGRVIQWDPVNEGMGKAAYRLAMEAGW
ncbi:MAG: DUF58 domain-containing protein [Cuniculiplasma sp.]